MRTPHHEGNCTLCFDTATSGNTQGSVALLDSFTEFGGSVNGAVDNYQAEATESKESQSQTKHLEKGEGTSEVN